MQLMINAPSILVCTKTVDFRKAIDGLLNVVLSELEIDPKENIFIFFNRTRDKVKILAWHKTGFVLLMKRLEQGRFFNISSSDEVVTVSPKQLSWLLAGLDWIKMSSWGELEYNDFH